MTDPKSAEAIGKALAALAAHAYRRRKRNRRAGDSLPGAATSAWEAMILEQAGPMRAEPIRRNRRVDLNRKI